MFRSHRVLLVGLLCLGCLDRPLGLDQPRTTSVISDRFRQGNPAKLDLLLVIDNSGSMADKQQVLAEAIPDLIESLTLPACVAAGGEVTRRHAGDGACADGTVPAFRALSDIQVGVITTSLGGFGADDCKTEPESDMAHLLPTLPRAAHIPSDNGVLAWQEGEPLAPFIDRLKQLVPLATDAGCGKEAPLEAWYRFLVDPAPYVSMNDRIPCGPNDAAHRCAQATRGADGVRLVDQTVLAQRAKFLRPDSLLAVAMLTDENDCSYAETSFAPLLSEAVFPGTDELSPAPRPSAACAADPENECCHACIIAPPAGCPSETRPDGVVVGLGCINPSLTPDEDAPNLRCFDQKRRFGMNLLHPVARYINALTQPTLCFKATDLSSAACAPEELSPNPLFFPSGAAVGRSPKDVFLVGVLGVPWQDVAVSTSASEPLVYLPAAVESGPSLNWDWIAPTSGQPEDPLMRPSVGPRVGTNPATGAVLAPTAAGYFANPINGHEWPNASNNDLQYACTFPLPEPIECDAEARVCDCKAGQESGNPLCQLEDGSYGTTQRAAKAYPGVRELQVLRGVGQAAVVASICAKEMQRREADDYGYRPAMQAIVDRLKDRLQDICLDRRLTLRADNSASCRIVEVLPNQADCNCSGVRSDPDPKLRASVERRMQAEGLCQDAAGCAAHCGCEIAQLLPAPGEAATACQTDPAPAGVGDGWCYLDEAAGIGTEMVQACAATQRQKIRFVGEGVTRDGSITYFSCQGSTYSAGPSQR